ncbi:MAG: hypothetical protein FJ011_02960 [Chloroflexi bacterium]|nr:hypothetical protein [Chloroflexota bacterium]
MTRIVADTTCGLAPAMAQGLGIPLIPQIIYFGEESFREGVEIDHAGFMARLLAGGAAPKTAAPMPGDFMAVFEEFTQAGFEHWPAIGIPYNYPYYGGLIEACGYARQRDFLSAYLSGKGSLPEPIANIAEKMKTRRGFSIKTFATKRELRAWVGRIVQTYNDTFTANWEFNPITEREGQVIGERLLAIADPRLIKLVMKGDDIAGFLFGFPDISEGIVRARGRLLPLGWFWILREFKRTKWINLNGAGILAPYRGLGVNAIMYAEMARTIQEGGFEHADLVQMEQSVLTLDDTRAAGGKVYKAHRIYEKALD